MAEVNSLTSKPVDDVYAVHSDILALIDELLPELDENGEHIHSFSTPFKTVDSLYGANPPTESHSDDKTAVDKNSSPIMSTNNIRKTAAVPSSDRPQKPPPKPPRRRMTSQQRAILAALCALNFCGYACYSNIAPFFPYEVVRKGGSATWTGLIFACYQLVMFIMGPLVGRYIEVVGARFMLIIGPFIAAWCCILFGFLDWVPHGPTFLALAFIIRMFEAVGSVMFVVVSMSIRPALFPNDIAFVYVSRKIVKYGQKFIEIYSVPVSSSHRECCKLSHQSDLPSVRL